MSMSELMNVFDYKNEKSFRDKYIKPLRQNGFISFTNPDFSKYNRFKTKKMSRQWDAATKRICAAG